MAESNKPSVTEEIEEMDKQDTQQATGDLMKQDKKASTKKAKKKKKKEAKGTGLVPVNDSRTTTTVPKEDGPEEVLTARNLQEMLAKLSIQEKNKPHEFWDTQPVPKLDEKVKDVGPIEVDKEDSIRQEPFTLPPLFVWDEIDLTNKDQLQELYTLLNENYVEDDDHLFRFDYTPEFLQWALQPPGWKKVWHCGVRVASNKKLVGFISAVPARIRIRDHEQLMVEINFLCVHKKLRAKRVAPVLIKEITRRVNMEGIFQAVYTAGVVLPKPVAVCRYWHRSLNPKKLVEVQFSSLHRHMTLQRMMRIYRIPDETKVLGLRPMEPRDAPSLLRLLHQELRKYDLAPHFHTEAEILHWFLPMPNIVTTYVYEDPNTRDVTDMVSFYHLNSTVVQHPVHKLLRAAYLFYCASTNIPMKDLIYDALVYAKRLGTDVFNALNIMGNLSILEELKFGVGDGNLHYYLYNWKCPEIEAEKVGLVLQ